MEKIKITQIDTKHFKMTKGSDIVLTLHDSHIEVFSWSENKTYDLDTEIWMDCNHYNKYNLIKKFISEISLCYRNSEELYELEIKVVAGSQMFIYFKTRDEVNNLYKKLTDWLNN